LRGRCAGLSDNANSARFSGLLRDGYRQDWSLCFLLAPGLPMRKV